MVSKIYTEPIASERKYRRLAVLGRELGVPVPQAFIEFTVTMPDGRVIYHHKQRSHSWCRNAYNHMISQLAAVNANDSTYAAGKISVKITTGTIWYGAYPITFNINSSMASYPQGYQANSGVGTAGIVVGYDTVTAENFEGYALTSPILEGTTNDGHHMNYILSQPYTYAYDTPSKTLTVTNTRYINNNSGGNVIVGEVALYVQGYAGGAGNPFMTARDHLGSPITIPNTGQLKATYTISLVYPS